MKELSDKADLKEINALKKKLAWGDVPTIYDMASSTIAEVDGILTLGFDNPYKALLNKNNWNFALLEGYRDENGDIQVKNKPQISLQHVIDNENYELHCFPIIDGDRVHTTLINNPYCPFIKWMPENMRMLFRMSSLISFIIYAFRKGDQADLALIKYAYARVEELIDILRDSFEVVDVKGYNILEFCKEINRRKSEIDNSSATN